MAVKIRSKQGATHYENLKVSEKAPLEVIKASYRALSMRWHPDKNPDDPHAVHMMRTLNEAYEVLSDPLKRQEYDTRLAPPRPAASPTSNTRQTAPAWKPRKKRTFSFAMVVRHIQRWNPRWILAGTAVIFAALGAVLLGPVVSRYLAGRAQAIASAPVLESKVAENTAPSETLPPPPAFDLRFTNPLNGQHWPKHASYLPGFEKLATDGYSSVTVDNSRNTSDVFLKLVSAETHHPSRVVRVCYIPARATFTFYRVTPGRYEMRYQEVEDGKCLKTETFVLSQTKRPEGVECTQLRVPLYGLPGRSVSLLQSDEREFIAATPIASR